jgi:hypothetical protein
MTRKFREILSAFHSQVNGILPQPSDGPILEIGPGLEGHSAMF